ncbi:NADH:quinone oxidoreductase [Pseudomonas sp. SDI]|uniref:Rnf-Nqr domain containing protein n=1 Tax=Pseudomonas sp. SDI TaxID=2170734 RepID=UPI000DE69AE3|nr:Rnf-Nqr domain containing protein [Pseudomonas sp. SDI]PWB36132.1 NADH:quinone oxidoreductase [Pseudomonas sp. SDI]
MTELLLVLLSAALANNIVLHQALAIDPPVRAADATPRRQLHALGLATLVLLVLAVSGSQLLLNVVLRPLQLESLRLLVFLPLCVLPVTPLLDLAQRRWRDWPLVGLKPLLLGNAAVLGLSLHAADSALGPLQSLALSLGSGLGFWLVLVLLDDLQQRIDSEALPQAWRGLPVTLASTGIMAMAFMGFNGMFGR